MAQPAQDLHAAVAERAQLVAGVRRQAAAPRREVTERRLPGRPGVPQPERRPHPPHRLVPAQLALAGERGEHGRRVGARHGAELEERVVVDRVRAPHLAQPEAALVHGGVPRDDGHGRAGDAAARDHAGGELVERRERAPDGGARPRRAASAASSAAACGPVGAGTGVACGAPAVGAAVGVTDGEAEGGAGVSAGVGRRGRRRRRRPRSPPVTAQATARRPRGCRSRRAASPRRPPRARSRATWVSRQPPRCSSPCSPRRTTYPRRRPGVDSRTRVAPGDGGRWTTARATGHARRGRHH